MASQQPADASTVRLNCKQVPSPYSARKTISELKVDISPKSTFLDLKKAICHLNPGAKWNPNSLTIFDPVAVAIHYPDGMVLEERGFGGVKDGTTFAFTVPMVPIELTGEGEMTQGGSQDDVGGLAALLGGL